VPQELCQANSTSDLLAYATYTWSSALESYGESRIVSHDIYKAFDCIWHKGLLAKLPLFGLHHTLITWIASFHLIGPLQLGFMASSLSLILST